MVADKKLKILIINSFYAPFLFGGAENSVKILSEVLVENGHEVTVLSLTYEDKVIKEIINGVKVVRIPLQNVYWPANPYKGKLKKLLWHVIDIYNIRQYKLIKKCFSDSKFDIINTNNISGFSVTIWGLKKLLQAPLIHTARDYYLFHPNCTLFSKGQNIDPNSLFVKTISIIKRKSTKKVDGFIAISKFIENIHLKNNFFSLASAKVIYNSIGESKKDKPTSKMKNNNIFGYLGRVEKEKGIEHILELFKNKFADKELVIAGDGDIEYINKLKEKFKTSNIKFLGKVKIADYFPEIDFLIVPSLWNEPMGRVVIESYSFGVPVISSGAGGIKELIDNGLTGFLYDPDDELDIIKSINKAQEVDYDWLSGNCIVKAESFNDFTMYTKTIEFYNYIINKY